MKTLALCSPRNGNPRLARLFLFCALLAFPLFAQPNPQGISMEEALEQANALLRSQGIDPTGDGLEPHSDKDSVPSRSADNPSATFTPLTLDQVRSNSDVWPAQIVMLETVDFQGGLRLTPGNRVDFAGFADRENVYLDYGEYNLTLPAAFTDLLERANSIASGKAKAEGFRGRLLEQLDGRIVVRDQNQMRKSSSRTLEGADLFLFYMSSEACGWCRQFTPKLVKAVQTIERQYPGRLKVIHASVDRNLNEFQNQYGKIDADAAIPPGDRWFINAFSSLHPGVSQIPQPSLMLLNVNGSLIDSGARQNRNTAPIDSVLQRLAGFVADSSSYSPAWTQLDSPLPLANDKADALIAPVPDFTLSTDPSIAGPEPYPATTNGGLTIPGLVLYDTTATGSRIPALTLQKVPSDSANTHYYVLSFRQVLGYTVGSSKPLLRSWLLSTTRPGTQAKQDLADRVDDFKNLHQKYLRWKETAISNGVTDFQKPIATLFQTRMDNPMSRPALAIPGQNNQPDPDLEVLFSVTGKPENATLKTETITWMLADIDAFTRLIPQIDLLVTQIDNEEMRLLQERREQVEDLQDIDALFQ